MGYGDARRSKRKIFDHVALLDFRDGEEPRPCQLIDISAGGARLLLFSKATEIPKFLTLFLSPTGSVSRNCKVAWRSGTSIGVQFLKTSRDTSG
jgi:hypothetical protein